MKKIVSYVLVSVLSVLTTCIYFKFATENSSAKINKDNGYLYLMPLNKVSLVHSSEDPIVVGLSLKTINKPLAELSDENGKFIERVIELNSNATEIGQLAEMWDKESFEDIKKTVEANNSIIDSSRNFFKSIKDTKILGLLKFDKVTVIYVQHTLSDGSLKFKYYPSLELNGRHVLSNSIFNDESFIFVNAKLKNLFESKKLWQ